MEYAKFSSLLWQSIIALYHKVFIDVDFYMSGTPTLIFFLGYENIFTKNKRINGNQADSQCGTNLLILMIKGNLIFFSLIALI